MKKTGLTFFAAILVVNLVAQNYNPTDIGSRVKFSIKNFGINVEGDFKGMNGTVSFDPANLTAASFVVSVDASSINTGIGSRDSHLKKETWFDVEKYPRISFVSGKITNSATPGTFVMDGKVSIKGMTKNVSFTFTATPETGGYLFSGEFAINRRDFGVGGSSLVLSDSLRVYLSVFTKKG